VDEASVLLLPEQPHLISAAAEIAERLVFGETTVRKGEGTICVHARASPPGRGRSPTTLCERR
jgi:hypothetical protein